MKPRRVSLFLLFFTGALISFSPKAECTEHNVRTLSHFSSALQKIQKMNVYIPESQGRHSVLYLLHGADGDCTDWLARTNLKNIADGYNVIIVMPDGGLNSWYVDSPRLASSRYESYVIKELIPFIDSAFATFAQKEGRGVCGLSMGGYGAIRFGLKYPNLFSSASSLSGVLAILRHPDGWSMPKVFGSQKEYLGNWQRDDLYELIQSSTDTTLYLKFDTGVSDFTLAENRDFVTILQKLHRSFEYGEFPGGHSWIYWNAHIEEHLQFHSRHLMKSQ